jgi:undecaprenyl-diphosphatase
MEGVDYGAYSTFHALRPRLALVTHLMDGISLLGNSAVVGLVVLAILLWLAGRGRLRPALLLLLIFLASLLLTEAVKRAIQRERPGDWPGPGWLDLPGSLFGFPSGHALVSAAAYGTAALILARSLSGLRPRLLLFGIVFLLVLLIGTSQLFLGYDFLTDVLAGWAAGLGLVLTASLFLPPDGRPELG